MPLDARLVVGVRTHSIPPTNAATPATSITVTGEIHKPDGTGSGGTLKEGLLENTTREDCDIDYLEGDDLNSDSAPVSAERDGFSVSDSSRYTSDGSTADKEDKELDTPYTQTYSVASSEDSSSNLREISTHSVSRTSLPYCNDSNLSLSPGKQVCKINNSFEHHKSGLLNRDDRKVQYDNDKAEWNNKEANNSGSNSHKKNTPRPIRKRRPTAVEKASLQRATKRHRFSSPLISDETEETEDDSDVSIYAPTKPYRTISPRSTGLWGGISDHKELKISSQSKWPRASQTAVIYEQQGWEGEIVDERDVKQGPGRPRKQYLVRWKPSWVDGGRLTMSEVVQNWRKKKASRCTH
ncbi:MAG: hypothetical protein LQ342_007947 [Letrouitia transgressa]|nr:MAG: hypothetical protein LQ342_007947 [Letrouitia transgressa]